MFATGDTVRLFSRGEVVQRSSDQVALVSKAKQAHGRIIAIDQAFFIDKHHGIRGAYPNGSIAFVM